MCVGGGTELRRRKVKTRTDGVNCCSAQMKEGHLQREGGSERQGKGEREGERKRKRKEGRREGILMISLYLDCSWRSRGCRSIYFLGQNSNVSSK